MTSWIVVVALAAAPKLAVPSFTGARPDLASFCAERLADELGRSGFSVVTEKQIGALLGLERQRQLMGCSNETSECLAELTNALGADALVSGSIQQLGRKLELDVRVFSAKSGERLAVVHGEAGSDEELPALLSKLSEDLVPAVRVAFGEAAPPSKQPGPRLVPWLVIGLGAASAIGGGVMLGLAGANHSTLTSGGAMTPRLTYAEGQRLASEMGTYQVVGWALVGVAVVALAVGVVLMLVGGRS